MSGYFDFQPGYSGFSLGFSEHLHMSISEPGSSEFQNPEFPDLVGKNIHLQSSEKFSWLKGFQNYYGYLRSWSLHLSWANTFKIKPSQWG